MKTLYFLPIILFAFVLGCYPMQKDSEKTDFYESDNQVIYQILSKKGFENAKTIIKRKNGRVTNLTIENANIPQFPLELNELDSLKSLILSNNQIEEVVDLSELEHLIELNMSNNIIVEFPSLRNLRQLKFLLLDNNQISGNFDCNTLPGTLETLSLSNNYITGLRNIDNLKNLSLLYMTGNNLKYIPEGICELVFLTKIGFRGSPFKNEKIDITCLPKLHFLYIDSVHIHKLRVQEDTKVIY